jgi:hypothetical protein
MEIRRFSRRSGRSRLFVVAAVLPLAAVVRADHQDFVVINASASPAYAQRKFVDGVPQRQTYALFQGKFFDGQTHDPSVDHSTFLAVAKVLAPDLAKQRYFPASAAPAADLLIVVNWGTTVIDPTLDKTFNLESPSTPNDTYVADALQHSGQTAMGYNSRLLGYDHALQLEGHMNWATPSGMNALEESHFSQLIDERYFVILLAYDYPRLQRESRAYQALLSAHPREARQLGPPRPHPVWSVRMNVRSAGNNFTAALPAMSLAASAYFGRQVEDLVDAPASVGSNSHVEVGETKVINVIK